MLVAEREREPVGFDLVESDISLDVGDIKLRVLTPDKIKIDKAFAPDYYLGTTKRAP